MNDWSNLQIEVQFLKIKFQRNCDRLNFLPVSIKIIPFGGKQKTRKLNFHPTWTARECAMFQWNSTKLPIAVVDQSLHERF